MRALAGTRRTGLVGRLALLVVGCAALAAPVGAASADGVVLHGVMVDRDPFEASAKTRAFPVTVYLKGAASRVDFKGPAGERGMLLDNGDGERWLLAVDQGAAVPVPSGGLGSLRLDPDAPCRGMKGRCEPTRRRFLAGVNAEGWRYRGADGTGPAGTSDGEFWIDPQRGLLLAWEGRKRGRDESYRFHADQFSHEPLPDVLFQLPESAALPGGDAS